MPMADPVRILYLAMYDPHVPYTGAGARGGEVINFFAGRAHVDLVYMEGSGHPGDPRLEADFAGRLRGVNKKVRVPFTQRGYFIFSRRMAPLRILLMRIFRYHFRLAGIMYQGAHLVLVFEMASS